MKIAKIDDYCLKSKLTQRIYECMNGILLSIVLGPGRWGEEKEGCGTEREVDKLLNNISSGSL